MIERRGIRFPTAVLLLPALLQGPSPSPSPSREETAVFAGGCFWGVEAVFEHVRGVRSVVSGYTGAAAIETVRIRFAPEAVSYRQLLEVFFAIAHDPTQRDRQGPDEGPEYRAVVYYANAAQQHAVETFVAELEGSHTFSRPIVTEIQPLGGFQLAEAFHQDYAARHPKDPYIVSNDLPKLERLRHRFPDLYRER